MAYLKFTRDKRGYEYFYLVQPSPPRRNSRTPSRVLYWFRSPPGVKVGREPFDAEIRRALAAEYPNIEFDWEKILATPIPSAEAEKWRERRRIERAARRTAREERDEPDEVEPTEPVEEADAVESAGAADAPAEAAAAPGADTGVGKGRRRHRRRRGRRGKPGGSATPPESEH